ncbi:MAG: hypothetical protein P8P65_02905 [Planktotalea sp.]|jgi:hypothetical protein|uniref:hypothetical protein n=1 Tax=Planktotalea sp. TaxID=2029877 RepID=UPI000183A28C|nr:hypothetical protein [Planktotalea sp.]EDZ43654.1 hypothetical protein RB2083_3169 [Rhodobacteraceae bacterium HTCC2083]MBT5821248.1 hypothetical protein [Paracoccaceae bacterium]MDG1075587.1 hypothetical protein [Planktotalea sp.]MDG1084846.1 hypothetical protein [Planktotalea sp.]
MIFTLIVGFVVGVFFAQASGFLNGVLKRAGIDLDDAQSNIVTFALVLAGAAIILSLIGVRNYPVLLCIGAVIGVARKSLLARVSSLRS